MLFDSHNKYRYGYESRFGIQLIYMYPENLPTSFPLFGSGKPRIHRTAPSSQIHALQLRANFLTPLKIHTTSCIDVACLPAAMFWGKTNRGKEADARQALEEKALALQNPKIAQVCDHLGYWTFQK